MGLLSIFQKRETPAQRSDRPAPAEIGPCRKTDFTVHSVGNGVHAVYTRNGAPRLLPSFAVEFALSCEEFRPLHEHVTEYGEKHGWDALQVDALEGQLESLFDAGALMSARTAFERLKRVEEPDEPPPAIAALGFPTGGDRTKLVRRAIESFVQNLRQHGRSADFLVSDNSARSEHRDAFRALARAMAQETGARILLACEEEKRRFSEELARKSSCPASIVEFALFDPHKTGFACGANRNALLLHGAGRMLCSVDDDVTCRMLASPERPRAALSGFSNEDPFSRWLFADWEGAEAGASAFAGDFLGEQSRMLGQSPAALLSEAADRPELDLSRAGDSLLRRLDARNLRVRATFPGHWGDPGIPASLYYLYYDGENRQRLTESEEHYRSVFRSRSVLSVVPNAAIGDAAVTPGMAMGLDHRELLPPFFPVLHAEDFSFGAALWQCCPAALLGHLPFAVEHAPAPGKPILAPQDLSEANAAAIFEFAHLLRRMLLGFAPPEFDGAAERMRAIGRQFEEWAGWKQRDFDEVVREYALAHASEQIEYLSRELDEDDEAPDFWRTDVAHLIEHLRSSLAREDFDVPLDLKAARSPAESRTLMRALIGDYGALLQHWPSMAAAARDLRENGAPLFR